MNRTEGLLASDAYFELFQYSFGVVLYVIGVDCTFWIDHDTVDAHVFVPSGVEEQVDPAESQTQHQEAQVLLPSTQIQPGSRKKEDGLRKTVHGTQVTY